MGESMPGTFRSPILLAREGSPSVRVTIPEGIATALEAKPGGVLLWTLDLKAGRVTVSVEPPEKSSKRS
ncbi:MAG TPA: hypothetical protein VMV28_00470 [Thermoplasmata archaeon]|nr:hypothetical protein [Thermoplasmata archaeon]